MKRDRSGQWWDPKVIQREQTIFVIQFQPNDNNIDTVIDRKRYIYTTKRK